jgi:hypothetical protein
MNYDGKCFASEIKGFDKFPSGRNVESNIVNQYTQGVLDASNQGAVTIAEEEEGERLIWSAHGKSRLEEG